MDYFKVALSSDCSKMNMRIEYTQIVAPFPEKSIKHDTFWIHLFVLHTKYKANQ